LEGEAKQKKEVELRHWGKRGREDNRKPHQERISKSCRRDLKGVGGIEEVPGEERKIE